MNRNLVFPLLIPSFLGASQHLISSPRPPNVILIFTDDQGYGDVGCYGAKDIQTPNLDGMAKEGIRLTDFYVAQAVSSASRASMLTGCYANRLGVHGAFMPNSKVGLNLSETTLAEMLKGIGYQTAIVGKWHLGDHPKFMPNQQGFDQYYGLPYSGDMWPYNPGKLHTNKFGPLPLYENQQIIDTVTDQSLLTTQYTERSIAFIEKNKEQPFFLYLAHSQPHVPLFVSSKFKGKSKRGLYGDVIMEIDWSVGEILKSLKKCNIDDNTLVIFTSDNGPWLSYGNHAGSAFPLREGKGTALEGGQREPCIIRYPGKIKGGRTINLPMMSIDILPTIAEITGAKLPELKIDGLSVLDLWTGKSKKNPHEAYFFYYKVNELQGVRYQNWKLYFPHQYRTLNGRAGGKDGLPVNYENLQINEIELYDLSKDISEKKNVASEHPGVVEKIKGLATEMRLELGDDLYKVKGRGNRAIGTVE